MRFDLSEKSGKFEPVEGWPASGVYDCKTATPKLSTRTGMLYVYNRNEDSTTGHRDWQVTGIDFRTGLRVVYSKLFFEKGGFLIFHLCNCFIRFGDLARQLKPLLLPHCAECSPFQQS